MRIEVNIKINNTIKKELYYEFRIQGVFDDWSKLYFLPKETEMLVDSDRERKIMKRYLNLQEYIENIENRIQKINEMMLEKVRGKKSFNFDYKLIHEK